MESMQEEAFVTAIGIGIRSFIFYRAVSPKVNDIKTRRVFELLAQEEAEHLKSFCNLFQDNEDELANILGKNNTYTDLYYGSLLNSVDGNITEKDALRIALKEEQACIEWLTVFVETIREAHIRDVFVRMLNETNKHAEMISEEYMRFMNMMDRTDQDI